MVGCGQPVYAGRLVYVGNYRLRETFGYNGEDLVGCRARRGGTQGTYRVQLCQLGLQSPVSRYSGAAAAPVGRLNESRR